MVRRPENSMRVVVVGTGYVGLACVGFTEWGHSVVGVDVDADKIARLNRGEVPIVEPGLPELVERGKAAGLLSFTNDLAAAMQGADVCIICVGTPAKADGSVDLQYIESAVSSVKALIEPTTVLVIKSTVPVGTCERLGAASNPEFLREGRAVQDFLHPDRVVIGSSDEQTTNKLLELYASVDAPKLTMSTVSSELTKYAANGFLATKISFVNEISAIAEKVGADIRDVTAALGMDPRIGPHFLRAGIGYGGSCFHKDTEALLKIADLNAIDFALLKAATVANDRARQRFVDKVLAPLPLTGKGELDGVGIAVWGLAFKANTDDVRKSAAIDVIELLIAKGATITVYDPLAMNNARALLGDRVTYAPSALKAIEAVDALLVLTEWPEFLETAQALAPALRAGAQRLRIFDGRNLLADLNLPNYVGVGLG